MRALLLVLGMAWLWAHPVILVLAALAEYGAAAVLIYALIGRLKRGSYGRHGRARAHPAAG